MLTEQETPDFMWWCERFLLNRRSHGQRKRSKATEEVLGGSGDTKVNPDQRGKRLWNQRGKCHREIQTPFLELYTRFVGIQRCGGSEPNHDCHYRGCCGMNEVKNREETSVKLRLVPISLPYLVYHIILKINVCPFFSLGLHFRNSISLLLFSLALSRELCWFFSGFSISFSSWWW